MTWPNLVGIFKSNYCQIDKIHIHLFMHAIKWYRSKWQQSSRALLNISTFFIARSVRLLSLHILTRRECGIKENLMQFNDQFSVPHKILHWMVFGVFFPLPSMNGELCGSRELEHYQASSFLFSSFFSLSPFRSPFLCGTFCFHISAYAICFRSFVLSLRVVVWAIKQNSKWHSHSQWVC